MTGMSRRSFVAAGAAAALAACARRAASVEDPAAPLGPIEPELRLYNWSDYIGPDTVAGFSREFGVRVTYDTYESNEEMLAKLLTGGAAYDLVVPSGYAIPVLRSAGALAPLHRRYLTNWDNLAPTFLGTPADPANAVSVPWAWGITGIAWRTDKLAAPPASWETFFDPRAAGRMTMMDDGREVLGAFLKYRGRSLNSTDQAELAAARTDALRAKPLLAAYLSAPVKAQLVAGDVWVAQLWNGDTAQAAAEGAPIAWALPKEGSLIWLDAMAIPADAPHKRAAHEFINYCLRPEVAAGIARATRYGSPNRAAQRLLSDPIPYPGPAELARLEYQRDLGPAAPLWDRTWTEVKAG